MVKIQFVVFLLIIYMQCVDTFAQFRQESLHGKVISASSGQVVNGANIIIKYRKAGSISDAEGNFIISGLGAGSYDVVVSHIGYQKKEVNVDVKPGQRNFVTILLEDTVFVAVPVEIIAHKVQMQLQQPQRIHTIDLQEITTSPAISISQMLDFTSGVISSSTTGIFSSRAVVSMRGMPASDQSRTLVVMDGMPLNKADGGSVNWNVLQKNNLEEIHVIKGPGPAKYGSSAMGGVIEIRTRRPSEKSGGEINLEYGSLNTISGDLRFSGTQKTSKGKLPFFWNLTANTRHSDGYITTPEVFHTKEDTILVPAYLEEYATALKTGFDFGDNHEVELHAQYFHDKRGNGVKVFDDFGAFSRHQTLFLMTKYRGMYKQLKWQLNIYNNTEKYFRVYEYMNEGEYKLYEADATRKDVGVNLDFDLYRFSRHKISAGLSGKSGSVDGRDVYFTSTDIIKNSGKLDIMAVYLQDEFVILKNKLALNAGIRYDYARFSDAHFTIDFPSYSIAFYKNYETHNLPMKSWDALSPRLSLRFNYADNSRIFVSYARGFRSPVLDDLSRTANRRGTFVIANPGLKPELIDAFELGSDVLVGNSLLLTASLFHSIGEDFMYFTSTGDTVNMGYRRAPIITRSNIGRVGISGMETEIRFDINLNLSCFGNYTFTKAKIIRHNVKDITVDSVLTGKYLTDLPIHKLSGGIRWQQKYFNTSVLAKFHGKTWINEWNTRDTEYFFSDRFDEYMIINIRFDKTFRKHFTASLQIDNIFDVKYIDDNLNESPGRLIFLRMGYRLSKTDR